jgi:hypothetical protein
MHTPSNLTLPRPSPSTPPTPHPAPPRPTPFFHTAQHPTPHRGFLQLAWDPNETPMAPQWDPNETPMGPQCDPILPGKGPLISGREDCTSRYVKLSPPNSLLAHTPPSHTPCLGRPSWALPATWSSSLSRRRGFLPPCLWHEYGCSMSGATFGPEQIVCYMCCG